MNLAVRNERRQPAHPKFLDFSGFADVGLLKPLRDRGFWSAGAEIQQVIGRLALAQQHPAAVQ